MTEPLTDQNWWREGVIYQIYPRSFQDSNGDGIGDLQGIIDRLDYLNDGTANSLGVDGIWLSPTFPSPMKDFGYDVADYLDVHPDFGTMATMDRLIAECHKRSMRVMLDFVPNHSSDQHPWFIEARSSKQSPKRDWYYWRDAKPDGSLPNNWQAVFGGSVWSFDEDTGQYYLHSFLEEQPDLNWRNPEVVAAMHDTLRFWLERGVDGFRIDVMGMVLKHPELTDNPPNPEWTPGDRTRRPLLRTNMQNYPDVYEAVRGIRAVLDEFPGAAAVGEVFGTPDEIGRYYGGEALDGLHLAFNFYFINQREPAITPWEAATLRDIMERSEAAMLPGAQPCYAFNNHDRPRLASRLNADGGGQERARAASLLLLSLRGTPYLYYGEETGMEDVDIPEHQLRDPARIRTEGRDPERTPMQWDDSPGRGFTTGEPWLPFGKPEIAVSRQLGDPGALLTLYRNAIAFRKGSEALRRGSLQLVNAPVDVLAFIRGPELEEPVLFVMNTASEPRILALPKGFRTVLLATTPGISVPTSGDLVLPPLAAAYLG
jgi:alpha-glucosidase